MSRRRFDLPLDQTAVGRFLPWTIAALVYAAVLALAVAAVADHALRHYHLRAQLVTVTLPPAEDAGQSTREIAAALDMLQQTRGVTSAQLVPPAELEALLEPFLGDLQDGPRAAAAAADRRHPRSGRQAGPGRPRRPAAGDRGRGDDRRRGAFARSRRAHGDASFAPGAAPPASRPSLAHCWRSC